METKQTESGRIDRQYVVHKWQFIEKIANAVNYAKGEGALTAKEKDAIISILAKKYDEWKIKEILPEDIFFDRLGRPQSE